MASFSLCSLVFIDISNNPETLTQIFLKVCSLHRVEAKAEVWQQVREQHMMLRLHCKDNNCLV